MSLTLTMHYAYYSRRFEMTASVPISAAHQGEDPAPLLPSNLKSNHMKLKTRSGEPSSPPDSTSLGAATHCTFESALSAPPQSGSHPLAQLRLRPASWSQESLDDDSDDDWPSRGQPEVPEKGKRTLVSPALSAPVPTPLAKRPVGSITGIFGREANIWASSLPYAQPILPYGVDQSPRSPPRDRAADNDMRENGSESDVEEWIIARRSSTPRSVPPTEDDESHEEPMDVDEHPMTPPRGSSASVSATQPHAMSFDVRLTLFCSASSKFSTVALCFYITKTSGITLEGPEAVSRGVC